MWFGETSPVDQQWLVLQRRNFWRHTNFAAAADSQPEASRVATDADLKGFLDGHTPSTDVLGSMVSSMVAELSTDNPGTVEG